MPYSEYSQNSFGIKAKRDRKNNTSRLHVSKLILAGGLHKSTKGSISSEKSEEYFALGCFGFCIKKIHPDHTTFSCLKCPKSTPVLLSFHMKSTLTRNKMLMSSENLLLSTEVTFFVLIDNYIFHVVFSRCRVQQFLTFYFELCCWGNSLILHLNLIQSFNLSFQETVIRYLSFNKNI